MNCEITKSLLLAIALASQTAPAYAQTNSPDKSSRVTKPTTSDSKTSLVQTAIDTAVETLPRNYKGNDCTQISKKLNARKLKKDEFETTADYEKRMSLGALPLIGKLTAEDNLAFAIEVNPHYSKYNADEKTMRVDFPMALVHRDIVTSRSSEPIIVRPAVVVDIRSVKKSTYKASNSFGKTVTVERTVFDVCGLVLNFKKQLGSGSITVGFDFELDPKSARSVKENLNLLFIAKLAKPYYLEFGDGNKATIDSPTESLWTGDALHVEAISVWAFDKSSGTILKKNIQY